MCNDFVEVITGIPLVKTRSCNESGNRFCLSNAFSNKKTHVTPAIMKLAKWGYDKLVIKSNIIIYFTLVQSVYVLSDMPRVSFCVFVTLVNIFYTQMIDILDQNVLFQLLQKKSYCFFFPKIRQLVMGLVSFYNQQDVNMKFNF